MGNLKKPTLEALKQYVGNYSQSDLFEKISKYAKKAGVKTVYSALLLYYALMDGEVPMKDKAIVLGALGYFILPADLVPDAIPFAGFSDDGFALLLALRTIWSSITESTKYKARTRLESWFGRVSDSDLKLF